MKYPSLRQGLVGAWCPSLGATGYRLLDRSGYNHHGTLTNMDAGTDWVGGAYGTALDFDGSNDYVAIRADRLPSGASPWTISFFDYPTAFGANNYGTVISWGTTGGIELQSVIIANNGNNGDGRLLIGQFGRNVLTTTTARPLNKWTHTAIVYGGGTDLRAYQNGLANGQGPISHAFNITVTAAAIGSLQQVGQHYLGQINDVRIYNRALTLAEIRLLASEPGIGLKPERTNVYFAESLSSRRRKILTGLT